MGVSRTYVSNTWKAKCPIFKAIVAGFRGKVASKNRTLGIICRILILLCLRVTARLVWRVRISKSDETTLLTLTGEVLIVIQDDRFPDPKWGAKGRNCAGVNKKRLLDLGKFWKKAFSKSILFTGWLNTWLNTNKELNWNGVFVKLFLRGFKGSRKCSNVTSTAQIPKSKQVFN